MRGGDSGFGVDERSAALLAQVLVGCEEGSPLVAVSERMIHDDAECEVSGEGVSRSGGLIVGLHAGARESGLELVGLDNNGLSTGGDGVELTEILGGEARGSHGGYDYR